MPLLCYQHVHSHLRNRQILIVYKQRTIARGQSAIHSGVQAVQVQSVLQCMQMHSVIP